MIGTETPAQNILYRTSNTNSVFDFSHMKKLFGIALGLISAIAYGTNPLFGVNLLRAGVGVEEMLWWRFAGAAILLAPIACYFSGGLKTPARDIPILAMLGVLFAASAHSLFAAFELIPAGIASAMLFLYPVFVAIIMSAFFKEKPKLSTIIAMAAALAGVAFLYADDAGISGFGLRSPAALKGAALVVVSALFYAFYIVAVKVSRVADMDGIKLTFYSVLFAALAAFALCASQSQIRLPHNWFEAANALGLVAFPTALSIAAISYSIKYAGATIAALLGAFEPATAVSISAVFLGEKFTFSIGVGIALISAATVVITASQNSGLLAEKLRKFHIKS